MSAALRVRITYCAECGYEPQTLALADALLREFGARLSAVELIPWEGGTFDVRVGEDLVHSMGRDGGFADHERIKEAARRALGRS